MPFVFSDQTSPSGMFYLRIDVSGMAELEDGQALDAQLMRPELRNGKVLSVVAAGTEYSKEVRKFFPSLVDKYSALAAVVTSPIVRAMINLMMRLTNHEGGAMRLFTTEDEALRWLEQQ